MSQFNPKNFTIEELAEEIQQYATDIETDANVMITHTKSDAGVIGLIEITVSLSTVTQMQRAILFMLNMNLIDQQLIVANGDDTYALSNGVQPVAIWNHIRDFVESCKQSQSQLAVFVDYVQPEIYTFVSYL